MPPRGRLTPASPPPRPSGSREGKPHSFW
ncbi:MAG: hypothetical protein QOG28_5959, partial [Trebonia sp.]|nr:hypothetical protein [Trebonia sp.]